MPAFRLIVAGEDLGTVGRIGLQNGRCWSEGSDGTADGGRLKECRGAVRPLKGRILFGRDAGKMAGSQPVPFISLEKASINIT